MIESLEPRRMLSADANGDNAVDLGDFSILAAHFNQPTTAGASAGDFDRNGFVDLTDFTLLARDFGKSPYDYVVRPGEQLPSVNPGQSVLFTGSWPSVTFPWNGTATNPITVSFDQGSTVGDGQTGTVVSGGTYLTIDNLEVLNVRQSQLQAVGAAVKINTGTTLSDAHIHDVEACGLAIYGTGANVLRTTIERAGQLGFTTQFASDVLIDSVHVLNCNNGLTNPSWRNFTAAGYQVVYNIGGLFYVNPSWEAGATKLWGSNRVTIRNSEAAYNCGPGFWTDYRNTNITIQDSSAHDNRGLTADRYYEGEGIRLELSPDAGGFTVANCRLENNTGAGITVMSVRDVNAHGNYIAGNRFSMLLRNDDGRGGLANIDFTGNTISDPIETWGNRFPLVGVVTSPNTLI